MTPLHRRRVVITGMGAVTPLGLDADMTWNGILAGNSPAAPIRLFDAVQFPCNFACQVEGFEFDGAPFDPRLVPYLNRAGRFGCTAAVEALRQAGLARDRLDSDMTAVCVGVGVSAPGFSWHADHFNDAEQPIDPAIEGDLFHHPMVLTSVLTALTGAAAGSMTVHTACASSGQALGEAFEIIAAGDADVCLTGGADSMLNPFQLAGFCLLGALSSRNDDPRHASRPFDEGRDGFVLGEGAAMFVFEALEHAQRRGATVLGEITGYGVTESAFRITDLHPEGRGVVESMKMALRDADITPSSIGYINAHGTSTRLNDQVESMAIDRIFGEDAPKVSSTKSMTGHLIAAAGAIEFFVCVKALADRLAPPSVNVFQQDPKCTVRLTAPTAEPFLCDYALSNSFGFGGSNVSLVARRYARE